MLATVLLVGGVALPASAAPERVDVIALLAGHPGQPAVAARAVAAQHGVALSLVYEHAVVGFAGSVPEGRLHALRNDPRVSLVELDQRVEIAAQSVPTGIERTFADGNATIDIDGTDDVRVDVDVAVIDTGIDLDHPDLNVVDSINCAGGSPLFASCKSGGDDDNGHGTHVAGSIAALDNNIGVVGVAPGARLHAVKVLDSGGSGYISWIVAGIDWVTARASTIEVANMSLACACSSSALDTAVTNSVKKGVVHVVAAGNSDANASGYSPASHPDVVTVSALADFDGDPGGTGSPTCRTDEDDTLANFSNFGGTIEIAAPGVCILSTYLGGGYATASGTSMASPHAAGAAALLASGNGDPTSRNDVLGIRQTLINTGNLNWTDDSGDGIKEPLLDVSNSSVFNPAMVDSGSGGDPLATMHVGDLDGEGVDNGGGWDALVWVQVHDDADQPLDGATVTATVQTALGAQATDTCVTPEAVSGDPDAGPGRCRMEYLGILDGDSPVTVTVTNVTHADHAYSSGDNHDPDGDSNGTAIVVAEPDGGGGTTPMHVGDLDGEGVDNGSLWDAIVWVEVHDDVDQPLDGATVTADIQTALGGEATDTCVTPESVSGDPGAGPGRCRLEFLGLFDGDSPVTVTVTNVTHTDHAYSSGDNHDPDGDSNGTTITVNEPSAEPPTNTPPTASFTYSCTDLECSFDGSGSTDGDGSITNYSWDFGDGNTATGPTANHTYGAGGAYTVTLTVTDDDSATDVDSQAVSVSEPPPPPSDDPDAHVGDLDDAGSVNQGSTWEARLSVFVEAGGSPVAGATVTFDWVGSRGSTGTVTCVTDASGWCTVSVTGLQKRESEVTFSVVDVAHASLAYDSTANHDPDGDSNGTSILLTKGA